MRKGRARVQAGQQGAQDISTPAGSRSCKDGDPTGQVQGGGGENLGENSQVRNLNIIDILTFYACFLFGRAVL